MSLKERVEVAVREGWARHWRTCQWADKGQPLVEESEGGQVRVRWAHPVDGRPMQLVRQGHVARVYVLILEAAGFRVGKFAGDDRGTYWTVGDR